jgi:hypothetical protein
VVDALKRRDIVSLMSENEEVLVREIDGLRRLKYKALSSIPPQAPRIVVLSQPLLTYFATLGRVGGHRDWRRGYR